MGRPKKPKQPRLLPKTVLEPIRDNYTLTFDDLVTRYHCRCGNTAGTGIRLEAIVCTRCGAAMKPVA